MFIYLHKTPYYREILDRNIKSEMYICIVDESCVIAQSGELQYKVVWLHSDTADRQTWEMMWKKKYYLHFIFLFYLNRGTLVLELFPLIVFQ